MIIRKAKSEDLIFVEEIYSQIHSEEEKGLFEIVWKRGIYPTLETATQAFNRQDLFVLEDEEKILGSAVINQIQVDVYKNANWQFPAPEDKVMVIHTLAISPKVFGKGYGRKFVEFYENYALENNCPYLRMDTNEKNVGARRLYAKLGYKEIGVFPCVFNNIPDINLVLIEKALI